MQDEKEGEKRSAFRERRTKSVGIWPSDPEGMQGIPGGSKMSLTPAQPLASFSSPCTALAPFSARRNTRAPS